MKKTISLFFSLVLIGTFLYLVSPHEVRSDDCLGGVTIYANCDDGRGCLLPQSGGDPIFFYLEGGEAFVDHLCKDWYDVCIPNCGTALFWSSGANETVVYVVNEEPCECPGRTSGNPVGSFNDNNKIPNVYRLEQNYPNPFNPVTGISFAIPKAGMVKLVVFDVLGGEVKTLVNEFKLAGSYTVDFDASAFSSGVYFYKIAAGDFTDIKKMVLVK